MLNSVKTGVPRWVVATP